tara:strand:+ start:4547 stop:5548 length:1002 start_codon:yes stop_codon:yes gene_type:complete
MNIENPEILRNYLLAKGLISPDEDFEISMLKGGVSAQTIYIDKKNPLVIKQSLSQLKTRSEWYSDPGRIFIENAGMKWLYEHLPRGSVPQPIFCDEENHLLIMEGISPPSDNLKTLLLNGMINVSHIESFGKLLGVIHQKGIKNSEAAKTFHNREFFINLRIEPYYQYASEKLPQFRAFFADLIQSTLDHQITIVHGDYSPKNILIKEGRLILLDHEVMHYGDPAFDVGFSLTHFLSKANYLSNPVFIDLALRSWNSYRSIFTYDEDHFERRCIKNLLGCMLARVHGKSPLEYLSLAAQKWQSAMVSTFVEKPPATMFQLIDAYKKSLDERKN